MTTLFTVFITCELASEIFKDSCFNNRQICHVDEDDETDLISLRDRFTTSLAITYIEKKNECLKRRFSDQPVRWYWNVEYFDDYKSSRWIIIT